MQSRKQHPAELRERAVAMVFELRAASGSSRGTLASVGHKLGVNPETLRNWVEKAEIDCGQRPGTYAVTYSETRRNAEDPDTAAVKQVDLWIEGKTAPLDIVSSLNEQPHELRTLANGTLSAELVKSFAEAAGDSITVRTTGGVASGTMIRIGNTGFARAFSKLATSCGSQPVQAEAHAELAPPREGAAGSSK